MALNTGDHFYTRLGLIEVIVICVFLVVSLRNTDGTVTQRANSFTNMRPKPTILCRFATISGNPLPLSVNLSTQSGKEKLAHLLLHTLHPHQHR